MSTYIYYIYIYSVRFYFATDHITYVAHINTNMAQVSLEKSLVTDVTIKSDHHVHSSSLLGYSLIP
jgi:hypothetical protein